MKVNFITKASKAMASRRYRADAVADYLLREGIMAAVSREGADDDTIRVYSKHLDFTEYDEAALFRRGGGKVVFDVCDHHYNHRGTGSHYNRMTAMADAVICSSEPLVEAAAFVRGVKDCIYRIPDMVLGNRTNPKDPLGVGYLWYGHPSNLPALVDILPALGEAFLEVVCSPGVPEDAFAGFRGQVSLTEWSEDAVAAALERAGAVLVPQRNDDTGASKGAGRALQAAWAGVPVIATATPEMVIADSLGCIYGTLVHAPETWADAVKTNQSVRYNARIMEDCQESIAVHYSPNVIGAKWAAVLEGL